MSVYRPSRTARGIAAARAWLFAVVPGSVAVTLVATKAWNLAVGLFVVAALATALGVRAARVRLEVGHGRLRIVNALRRHDVALTDVGAVVAGRHLLVFGCLAFTLTGGRRIAAAATELNGLVSSLDAQADALQGWLERELPSVERRYRSIPIAG